MIYNISAMTRPQSGRTYYALALVLVSSAADAASATSTEVTASARRRVAAAAAAWWEHQLDNDLELRLRHGLRMERLPELSPEALRLEGRFAESILARLAGIRAGVLEEHVDWFIREEQRGSRSAKPHRSRRRRDRSRNGGSHDGSEGA